MIVITEIYKRKKKAEAKWAVGCCSLYYCVNRIENKIWLEYWSAAWDSNNSVISEVLVKNNRKGSCGSRKCSRAHFLYLNRPRENISFVAFFHSILNEKCARNKGEIEILRMIFFFQIWYQNDFFPVEKALSIIVKRKKFLN